MFGCTKYGYLMRLTLRFYVRIVFSLLSVTTGNGVLGHAIVQAKPEHRKRNAVRTSIERRKKSRSVGNDKMLEKDFEMRETK